MTNRKVIVTQGLPASGKTTWSKEWVAKDPTNRVRVNKDDLRAMLHGGHYSKGNEKQIISIQEEIIKDSLIRGKSIVVDDTNLATQKDGLNKHWVRIVNVVMSLDKSIWSNTSIDIKKFNVEPEECIKRDLKRANSVGSDVIWRMYWQNVAVIKAPVHNPHISNCIIVDIDGTLAQMNGRHPFQWDKVGEDLVRTPIKRIVDAYHHLGYTIILMSGRDAVCKQETIDWLDFNCISYDKLFMRPEGNCEKDTVIKERLYTENIEGNYNVLLVVDDRPSVIRMWTKLGLPVVSAEPTTWEF